MATEARRRKWGRRWGFGVASVALLGCAAAGFGRDASGEADEGGGPWNYEPAAKHATLWAAYLAGEYEALDPELDRERALGDADLSLLRGLRYDFGLGLGREPERAAFWYGNAWRLGLDLGALALLDQAESKSGQEAGLRRMERPYLRARVLPGAAFAQVGPFEFGAEESRSRNLRAALGYNRERALGERSGWALANVASLLEDGGNALIWNAFGLSQVYRMKAQEEDAAASAQEEALAYRYGFGVERDVESARRLYELGSAGGRLDSRLALGRLLVESGEVEEGVALWEEASWEDASAREDLAELYWDGEGVEQDFERTRRHLREAADLGNAHAASDYARYCLNGWGGPVDLAEARRYFQRAAARGGAWGARHYGAFLREHGETEAQRALGRRWLERAASLENRDAMREVARLAWEEEGDSGSGAVKPSRDWMEWALAHDLAEVWDIRLRPLMSEYVEAVRSGRRGTQEDRLWEASRRAMAAGSVLGVEFAAVILFSPSSERHDPELAVEMARSRSDESYALFDMLLSRYASAADGREGAEERAWELLSNTSHPVADLQLYHMLLYPKREPEDMVAWVKERLADGRLPERYADLASCSSVEDIRWRIAERVPMDSVPARETASRHSLGNRALVDEATMDLLDTPLRRYIPRFTTTLELIVGANGEVLRSRAVSDERSLVEVVFERHGRFYRWEPAPVEGQEAVRVRIPVSWSPH